MRSSTTSPIDRAEQLLQSGRPDDAVATLMAAGQSGDATACFQLAAWFLIGQRVPRDLQRARALLRQAVIIGHADAALLEIALTANGSGAASDWPRALALLATAARMDPMAAVHQDLLVAAAIDAEGRPLQAPLGEPLSEDRIVRFSQFATAAECEHIAHTVGDLLAPATVIDSRTGRHTAHPVRTSYDAVIGPMRESLAVQAINNRIAMCSGTAVNQGEPLTVLRYSPGQQFRLHHDSIAHTRNQRSATMLLYLNDGYIGGETVFPDHNLTITPRRGDAILFQNTKPPEHRPDPRARHAGLPVTHGVKWLATRWIRTRAFSPWTGPEAV